MLSTIVSQLKNEINDTIITDQSRTLIFFFLTDIDQLEIRHGRNIKQPDRTDLLPAILQRPDVFRCRFLCSNDTECSSLSETLKTLQNSLFCFICAWFTTHSGTYFFPTGIRRCQVVQHSLKGHETGGWLGRLKDTTLAGKESCLSLSEGTYSL